MSSSSSLAELDLLLVEAGHHLVVGGAGVVVALDRRAGSPVSRRDDRLDVEAGEELDVVDGVEVRRIGHRHDERRAGARDRDDLVLVADLARDELEHLLIDLVLVEVDRGHAVLRREEVGDLAVGDVAELGQRGAQVLAGLALLVLRLPELLEADELLADEQLAEAVHVRHTIAEPLSTPGKCALPGSADPSAKVLRTQSKRRAAGNVMKRPGCSPELD